jgi:hypothetical protein
MNSAVILKLEYRFPTVTEFTSIAFTGFSANLTKQSSGSSAGILHVATLQFRIPKCDAEKDRLMVLLSSCRAIQRATDANGSVYLIGGNSRGAQLLYNRSVDGKPGGLNGYDAVITYKFKGVPLITTN